MLKKYFSRFVNVYNVEKFSAVLRRIACTQCIGAADAAYRYRCSVVCLYVCCLSVDHIRELC